MLPFNAERSALDIEEESEDAAATVVAKNRNEAATKRRPSTFEEGYERIVCYVWGSTMGC